jgi:hypothetical protein
VSGGYVVSVNGIQGAVTVSSVGVGQSWSTPSRALNTTYTNSTGKPIMVNVSIIHNTNQQSYLAVNGVNVAYTGWQGLSGGDIPGMLSAIVPNGATYAANTSNSGYGNGVLSLWAELS